MKNIAVFTSIRSEYGLLMPLLRQLEQHDDFNLKLMVGGAHLLEEYGKTVNQIIADGFTIDERLPFLYSDSEKDVLHRSIGLLQYQAGKYFSNNPTDLLLVLGDRFELIPVVLSALLFNIPIAHISGGEVTEGAIDNQIRHAITKMAHIHFPATEKYRENIIRMGEEEWRVVRTGEPGLDLLNTINYVSKDTLFEDLGLSLEYPVVLCTFHPETISNKITAAFVKEILERILNEGKYQVLLTASNFDEGGNELNRTYEELSSQYSKISFVKSLGQLRYYSMLKYSAVMLGNSSSGLVEAQSFQLPVVNVGNRQAGRLSNVNVINAAYNVDDVMQAIALADSGAFRNKIRQSGNIYGDGNACEKIIEYLEKVDWTKLVVKRSTYE